MILSYVYKLTHKETYQFYIGSRTSTKQKLPADFDILKYKSSSKYVKELGFENFNIEIIAEFFDPKDAYDFEQNLIKENFKNPLILNKRHHADYDRTFYVAGINNHNYRKITPQEVRDKISIAQKGKSRKTSGRNHPQWGIPISAEIRDKISKSLNGNKHFYYGKKFSLEHRKRISESNVGVSRSEIQTKYSSRCTPGHINKIIRKLIGDQKCHKI
jgi:hypothetical protein